MQVACVQMCSGRDVDRNIASVSAQIRQAAAEGADLVATPEVTNLMEEDNASLRALIDHYSTDRSVSAFSDLARELEIDLLIGSLALKGDGDKLVNRSMLFNRQGELAAYYDKIHMFDVDLGGGESYRESANYSAGDRAVLASVGGATLGMSICYDVRFAALYRKLARAGAQILSVPAAFTVPSGKAHWHVLLRARAIETGCFVIAPAQCGHHENGRDTYGHSLIINPWGEIVGEAGTEPGIIQASIDIPEVARARNRIPALQHDREFSL